MGQLVACATAEGQRWHWLIQGRQVLIHLSSCPAQSTLDTVTLLPQFAGAMSPGGCFCFSVFSLAAMEVRAIAPVQVSGQSGPGWEKKKLLPAPTLQKESGAPTTSLRGGTRTKGSLLPSLDPNQDNSMLFQVLELTNKTLLQALKCLPLYPSNANT